MMPRAPVLLHPALLTLLKLQGGGLVRRGLRGTRTLKGKLFLLIAAAVGILWLGPAVAVSFFMPRADPALVRLSFSPILLTVALVTALTHGGDRAVAFTASEINFLFPGPFTRRELLVYKIAKAAAGAVLTSAFMSLVLLRYGTHWLACFLGTLLSLLFLQLLAMSAVMVRQTLWESTRARWRRIILLTLGVGLAVAAMPVVRAAVRMDAAQVRSALQESATAQVLLTPAKPFAMTFTAQRYLPDLIGWAAVCAIIDALLLALVLRIDANLIEVSLAASARVEAQQARVRTGQILGASGLRSTRWRMPALPRWGGVGAIAWRQLSTVLRTGRGMLLALLLLAAAAVPGMLAARSGQGPLALLPVLAWITLLTASMLKFDFRADLDRMDLLKSLPLRPSAVAAGQLAAPSLVLLAFHLLVLSACAAMASGESAVEMRRALGWAAMVALPFDVLIIGSENLVFLIAPARPAASTPGDLSAMGRHVVLFFVKTVLVLLPCGLAALLATAAFFGAGRSVSAAGAAALLSLAVMAVGMIPLVGWAFARFDPSVDTPA